MKPRCQWCGDDPLYVEYHDEEWGVPVKDDHKLFEFLILEGAQAGLSWITILKKREGYRALINNFDDTQVARYSDQKLESILLDERIVRNRLKVFGARKNALAFLKVQKEFGSFANYLWGFVDNKPIQNQWSTIQNVPATTAISDAISKDMKKRGFTFVGSTIMYAHMQATGMVNDHTSECFRYKECQKLA